MSTQRLLRPLILTLSTCFVAEAKTYENIPCRDVPAAVRAVAANQKTRQGTQPSCERITDKGETLYEVKVTVGSGKMREIVFRPDGQITEVEDESELSGIPPAARAAIVKAVAAGELRKVDIIRRGSTLLYEGEYRRQGAKKKVIVDAGGRVIPE